MHFRTSSSCRRLFVAEALNSGYLSFGGSSDRCRCCTGRSCEDRSQFDQFHQYRVSCPVSSARQQPRGSPRNRTPRLALSLSTTSRVSGGTSRESHCPSPSAVSTATWNTWASFVAFSSAISSVGTVGVSAFHPAQPASNAIPPKLLVCTRKRCRVEGTSHRYQ